MSLAPASGPAPPLAPAIAGAPSGRRRIETAAAQAQRSRRQRFAAPGGAHDRLVRLAAAVLPMGVGVIAALMLITPLSPRGEISFLLDRDEVEVIDERLSVDSALYRGQDAGGRPFSLTAHEAVQRSGAEGIVRMDDVVGRLLLREGPARLVIPAGRYDLREATLDVDGTVRFAAADGYRMDARGVAVDFTGRRLVGRNGVSGAVPAGTFSADRLVADLDARTVALVGRARLRMEPGRLKLGQDR